MNICAPTVTLILIIQYNLLKQGRKSNPSFKESNPATFKAKNIVL